MKRLQKLLIKLKDLEDTGIKLNSSDSAHLTIYIVKNNTGYGAYLQTDDTLVCSTKDYKESEDGSDKNTIAWIQLDEWYGRDYPPTNFPYVETTVANNTGTVEYGAEGPEFTSDFQLNSYTTNEGSSVKITGESSVSATSYVQCDITRTINGYYTDDQGTIHEFTNGEEKQ